MTESGVDVAIRLENEIRTELIASIRRYFDEQLEEEIGDLKARLLLDYVLEEIGPCVYNQAIADAQAWMTERVADLEGTCHEEELGYWPERKRR